MPHFSLICGEGRIHAGVVGHVSGDHRVHADGFHQRPHPALEVLALIGEGDLRALRRQLLGDAPRDGAVIRDAHHEAALALHQVACGEGPFGHGDAPCASFRGVGASVEAVKQAAFWHCRYGCAP